MHGNLTPHRFISLSNAPQYSSSSHINSLYIYLSFTVIWQRCNNMCGRLLLLSPRHEVGISAMAMSFCSSVRLFVCSLPTRTDRSLVWLWCWRSWPAAALLVHSGRGRRGFMASAIWPHWIVVVIVVVVVAAAAAAAAVRPTIVVTSSWRQPAWCCFDRLCF